MQKYTYYEISDLCYEANEQGKEIEVVAVISPLSFSKDYTLKERSYKFSSKNKRFMPNQNGLSIYADCLDGKDLGVRLDWYIFERDGWKVDYFYIVGDPFNVKTIKE